MKLLLDTHTFLWWIDNSPSLSPTVRELILSVENDPFDRLLIAQCQVENMVLLSADKAISNYDLMTIW